MSGSGGIAGFRRSLAFFVAIDRYTNGVPALRTPVGDAEALARALEHDHGFATTVVADEAATLPKLQSFLSSLVARTHADDRVVFYFAGHGIASPSSGGPRGFILPQDADRTDERSYFGMLELQAALEALPCRHMLVFLDCCFAGAMRWASYRDLSLVPERLHQERYEWYVRGQAWQAIASAAHNEKALDVVSGETLGRRGESGRLHSPFAQALLDGLAGAADLTGDGVITASELHVFLNDRLHPADGGGGTAQHPLAWLLRKHGQGEFVFLVPGRALELPPAPPLNRGRNPWRGLRTYKATHKDLFFGRGRVARELSDFVLGSEGGAEVPARSPRRFVVVTGPSGIGKSSLVRAGLIPGLPPTVQAVIVRPSKDPFGNLASALRGRRDASAASIAAAASPGKCDGETRGAHPVARRGGSQPCRPHDRSLLAAWLAAFPQTGRVILVVDQAEELFTMSERTEAEAFLEMLAAGLDEANERLQVVMTVRSEFEPQLADTALAPRWEDARFIVPQMTQDELRRVIKRPAAARVMRFEDEALVDCLINEVVNMPGGLPLLSFALSEMYLKALVRGADDRTLTWADYAALEGGVIGALRVRANGIFEALDPAESLSARRMLERLVAVESSEFARRRVTLDELEMAEQAENRRVALVRDKLLAARLIVGDYLDGQATVELSHDALVASWPQLLSWVRDELENIIVLRRLTDSANQWAESGGPARGLLWADPARQQQIAALRATPARLNKRETAFADESSAQAARNRRRRAAVSLLLVGLTVVAVITALVAEGGRREAREQRDEAVTNRSRLLANLSEQHDPAVSFRAPQAYDYTTAALLADEALGAIGTEPRSETSERALYQSLMQNREVAVLGGFKDRVEEIAVSPSGARIAAASLDWSVRVWSGKDYRDVVVLSQESAADDVLFRDEDSIVTLSYDGKVAIWDLRSRKLVKRLEGITGSLIAAAVGAGLLAVAHVDESGVTTEIGLYDIETLAPRRTIKILSDALAASLYLSPSGKLVSMGHWDGSMFVWRTDSGDLVRTRKLADRVNAIRIFDNDRKVLATTVDGPVVYDLKDDSMADRFDPVTGQSMDTAVDEASGIVAEVTWQEGAGAVSGLLHLQELSTGRRLATAAGHRSYLTSVEFIPGRELVATGSADGTVRLWSTATQPNISRVEELEQGHLSFLKFAPGKDELFAIWSFGPDGRKRSELRLIDTSDATVLKSRSFLGEVREAVQCEKKNLLILVTDDEIIVVDGATLKAERRALPSLSEITSLATDAACERLALGDVAGFVHEGTVASGGPFEGIAINTASIIDIEYSPDGSEIATGSADKTVGLYDREARVLRRLRGHAEAVVRIGFGADGKRLLSSTMRRRDPIRDPNDVDYDDSVRIWDVDSGAELARLEHDRWINVANFSPDGLYVVSASGTALQIWRADTGVLVGSLDAHSTAVADAQFTGGGARLVTRPRGILDGKDPIRVWDMASRAVVAEIRGHDGAVIDLDLNDAGTLVAYRMSRDDVIRIARIFPSPDDLRLAARQRLPRCLTLAQRANFGLSLPPPVWCHGRLTGLDVNKRQEALWPYTTSAWRQWAASGAHSSGAPGVDASNISGTGNHLFSITSEASDSRGD